ncbi:hypothetical protein G9A89_016008 [Geosiphon pyriformis]|nr:hypothetical protein G9A89_016008 [Geosiphon pyriformis]
MAYAPIAKLDNFTDEKNNAQDTANSWYQSLVNKPQDFNAFKVEFLRYFSNNNSINCLVNTFTTMKQGETEVVTTYLGRFHQNLCQIQAIDANYFTASQILNQFIRGLRSSILQHICLLHLGTLQNTVTRTKDFESAESETNHAQAVNLVMNGSSELDSKLENLHNDAIIKETLIMPKINHVHFHRPINNDNRKHVSATIVRLNNQRLGNQYRNPNCRFSTPNHQSNSIQYQTTYLPMTQQSIYQLPVYQALIYQPTAPIYQPQSQVMYQPQLPTIYQPQMIQTPPQNLPASGVQRLRITQQNWRLLMVVHQPIPSFFSQTRSRQQNSGAGNPQNPNFQNYLSLLVTPEDTSPSNQELTQKQQTCISNISPATVTNDESLDAIFLFELEEPSTMPLFSGTVLEEKPITTMYINAKIDGHYIKLILDSGSAGSIITQQLMDQLGCRVDRAASARIIMADEMTKTLISKIDDLPIEINGIIVPIKVLIMEATQCQALNTQELQLSQNGQHMQVPAMYSYFKATNTMAPLINFEEKKQKPTWKAYQVSWANEEHNKLPPILSWDDNGKGKQTNELT